MDLLTDIDLSLSVPRSAKGAKAKELGLEVVRELNEGDLAMIQNPPSVGSRTPWLVRLGQRHHMLARLVAEGRPDIECAAITGYSQSRISILKPDPAFKELVEYYKTQVEEVYLNVHERLAALGISCMEELQARLDEEPDTFSQRELKEIMETSFERTVAPSKGSAKVTTGGNNVAVILKFVSSPNQGAPLPSAKTTLELSADDE